MGVQIAKGSRAEYEYRSMCHPAALRPASLLRRSTQLILVLCLLASPTHASATAVQPPTSSSGARALASATRQLHVVRKRRGVACRRAHSQACQRIKAQERRARARVARLRKRGDTAAPKVPAAAASTAAPPPAATASVPEPTPVPAEAGSRVIYVAPSGNDTAAGTAADPLATLGAALSRAAGGEHVVLAPGAYPHVTDARARTTTVTVLGPGAGSATVAGMTIAGGQELEFSGVTFTDLVAVVYHASRKLAQPARDIAFHHDEFTAHPGGGCISARNGVQALSITDSSIHECTSAFGAAAGGAIPQSRGLTIARNRLDHFTNDAIQFGQWDDVKITDNVISNIYDPAKTIHNDGIQLTGNSRRVVISGNRIFNSRDQLIFIQDAVGPIDDVDVATNVVYGAGAVAIQSQGATNARFINNTVWRAKDGGLWLTQGYPRAGAVQSIPKDTVVINNVLQTYRRLGGAWTATSAGNVGLCLPGQRPTTDYAAGWTCMNDLGFVDAATDQYRLRDESPARQVGSTLAMPPGDIDGLPRTTAVPGAFR